MRYSFKKSLLKNTIILFFLLYCLCGHSQIVPEQPQNDSISRDSISQKNDLIWLDDNHSIELDEILIVSSFKFKTPKDRREYLILKRKTERVWPYVVLASERLNTLTERLDKIDNHYDKVAYTQRVQSYMEKEFADQLKKLTKTEGQILVKLLYRQTGETTYNIVKELRSGFRAFRYNITAGFFTISLKEKYNPLEVKEDFYIEHILRRDFQSGTLEYQKSAIDIDFVEIMNKWEGEIKAY